MALRHNQNLDRNIQKKQMTKVIAISFLLMLVEIIVALFSKSMALLADAAHILADIAALTLGLIAIWFASKPPTPDKTYGYYRSEILAGFVNAFLLVVISIFIISKAWQGFNIPHFIEPLPVLAMALLSLLVNLICLRLLSDNKVSAGSVNLKTAGLEIFGDVLASVGVLVSGLVILFFHWYQADALVSCLIGFFILGRTWQLLKECTNILMEGTPSHVDLGSLKNAVLAVPNVFAIHDMHVWTITSGLDAMSAHVLIDKNGDQNVILNTITDILHNKFNLKHTTIQIEQASCEKDACS